MLKKQELQDFEEIFNANYSILCKQVSRITRDVEAAEDIVQEVFVNFWESHQTNVENPQAYLYKVCINKALDFISVNNRRREINDKFIYPSHPTETRSLDQDMEFQELERQVLSIIESLPPMCRKVFLLSRYEEMSHKEIAAFLEISPNTVDNHIKKALSVLRKISLLFFFLMQVVTDYTVFF
jgi:RNA polymerase sigma-70 factor (ECF subfamily)